MEETVVVLGTIAENGGREYRVAPVRGGAKAIQTRKGTSQPRLDKARALRVFGPPRATYTSLDAAIRAGHHLAYVLSLNRETVVEVFMPDETLPHLVLH